mgnify:CR=1 FL=1
MARYDANGEPIVERPRPRPRQMRPIEDRLLDPNPGVARQAREQSRSGARYDVNGNPITPAPFTNEEAREDAGASFVTGLQRGAASVAGAPGDARDAAGIAAQIGSGMSGLDPEAARGFGTVVSSAVDLITNRGTRQGMGMGPNSEEVNDSIQQVFGPQHEPQTTAGEYARTIGEFAPAVAAPGGPVARVARAVVPAIASEGAGQLTEGSDLEGPARIVAALVAGGVSEGTIQFLTRQGLTPDQRALRLIERELRDAGYSPEEITRVANRLTRQAPTEEVLGELMGPSGQRLMRATAAMGQGAGRSTATNVLDARALGRPGPVTSADPARRGVTNIRDRVMGEAARTFAPEQTRGPNSYWDALDALRSSRAAQGAENYRNAYAAQVDQGLVQQHLAPLMTEAPDAARSAAKQLEFEARRLMGQRSQLALGRNPTAAEIAQLDADIADVRSAQQQLTQIAEGARPNTVSTRAIDYFQRGLQQAEQAAGRGSPEAGAMASFRHGFNGLADRIAPALGDTRAQYGRSMAIQDYMDEGRRVFQMSEGEIDRVLRGSQGRGLSTEEFDGFQLGVLDAVENKLGAGDTGFLARLARNRNWTTQLERAAGGTAEARRFMNRLAREASMQQTRNFVNSGSRTAPLQEDIKALTEGESELAFLNDHVRSFISTGGNTRALAIRIAAGLYDRFRRPGIANPRVQEAMAQRLFGRVTRDSAKELRDALLSIRNDPALSDDVRVWLNRMVAIGAANESEEALPAASEAR